MISFVRDFALGHVFFSHIKIMIFFWYLCCHKCEIDGWEVKSIRLPSQLQICLCLKHMCSFSSRMLLSFVYVLFAADGNNAKSHWKKVVVAMKLYFFAISAVPFIVHWLRKASSLLDPFFILQNFPNRFNFV